MGQSGRHVLGFCVFGFFHVFFFPRGLLKVQNDTIPRLGKGRLVKRAAPEELSGYLDTLSPEVLNFILFGLDQLGGKQQAWLQFVAS